MPDVDEEMEAVGVCLTEAAKYHLETEVVCWALKALKDNPNLTIIEAINIGLNEWVK